MKITIYLIFSFFLYLAPSVTLADPGVDSELNPLFCIQKESDLVGVAAASFGCENSDSSSAATGLVPFWGFDGAVQTMKKISEKNMGVSLNSFLASQFYRIEAKDNIFKIFPHQELTKNGSMMFCIVFRDGSGESRFVNFCNEKDIASLINKTEEYLESFLRIKGFLKVGEAPLLGIEGKRVIVYAKEY